MIGRIGWAMFGGVLILVAKKRLYSSHHQTGRVLRQEVRQFMLRQPAGAVTPLSGDNSG